MKFSLIALASAIALSAIPRAAASADLHLYSKKKGRGDCKQLTVPEYDTCYNVSDFSKVKSISFLNRDPDNTGITIFFYKSEHCDDKFTSMPGEWPAGSWQHRPRIDYAPKKIRSFFMAQGNRGQIYGRDIDRPWITTTKAVLNECS
jgi:hypothetical protein